MAINATVKNFSPNLGRAEHDFVLSVNTKGKISKADYK